MVLSQVITDTERGITSTLRPQHISHGLFDIGVQIYYISAVMYIVLCIWPRLFF